MLYNIFKHEGIVMTYNYDDYLMTPEEFADVVVATMHDQDLFHRNTKYHPEDIEAAFSQIAYTVAKSISHLSIRNNVKDKNISINTNEDVYSRYSEWKRTKKSV
jgi:hypothetical protein